MVDEKVKFYNDCNREVAKLCNHKKAESKNLKEQLAKLDALIKDKEKELKDLENWKKQLKAAQKDGKGAPEKNPKNFPKTVDACETKSKKLKE